MQNEFHMFANDAAEHSGYIFCSERHLAQLMLIISSPKNNQGKVSFHKIKEHIKAVFCTYRAC